MSHVSYQHAQITAVPFMLVQVSHLFTTCINKVDIDICTDIQINIYGISTFLAFLPLGDQCVMVSVCNSKRRIHLFFCFYLACIHTWGQVQPPIKGDLCGDSVVQCLARSPHSQRTRFKFLGTLCSSFICSLWGCMNFLPQSISYTLILCASGFPSVQAA